MQPQQSSKPILAGILVAVVVAAAAIGTAVVSRQNGQGVVSVAPVASTPYVRGLLPDPSKSPGDVLPGVTAKDVCVRGYAKSVRNVPQSEKDAVYREYGMDPHNHPPTEIDHICSLELGGSNDIKNLFPEPYDLNVDGTQEGARQKDRAEDATHAAVCSGRISLADAQQQIRTDWRVLYRRFVSPAFPKWSGGTP